MQYLTTEHAPPEQLRPISEQVCWEESIKALLPLTLSQWFEKLLLEMHLKLKGYCVLLIYTITTITLPSVYPTQTSSHVGNRVLTARGLTHPRRQRLQLGQRQAAEPGGNLPYLENRDRARIKTSAEKPGLGPRMVSTAKNFTNRDRLKETRGELMYTILNPPNEDCREGGIKPVIHGKFYIPGQLEANIPNVGYQADSAVPGKATWVIPLLQTTNEALLFCEVQFTEHGIHNITHFSWI